MKTSGLLLTALLLCVKGALCVPKKTYKLYY
jgi:hypothetical protein